MNKMIPLFLILAIIVLGGLAVAGYKMRQTASPAGAPTTQTTYPSGTVTPTGTLPVAPSTPTGYQAGISISVSSPANGSEVTASNVMVAGKTSPNAEVFVNDASGKADANGYFSISVSLDEGDNVIIVAANDANGNSAEQEITVSYNPAQ